MLFNSFEFFIFLPIVFIIYWLILGKNLKIQNLFIVLVSYLFYGWWDFSFLYLIAFTSICSWGSGLMIEKHNVTNRSLSKIYLIANITVNLLILGLFKYFNFFVDSFVTAFSSIGIELHPLSLQLILPVGISFYTFQALSYSIDVYRKRLQPTTDIVAFFAYVSFFPQLVAGPIERATNLLPQFYVKRNFDIDRAKDGLRQMLWGFFKKIVIADNCAIRVNEIFDNYENLPSFSLWIGAILFTFQIYGDFSGYSDIAIGTARLFGIDLKRNFNFPYFSRDIAEFWRRWHISLTTWFRDYIYIPLGGSKEGKTKAIRNTMIIFLVSGLWHGANWTFILWGLFHALLFLPLLISGVNTKYKNSVAEGKFFPSIVETTQMLSTFLCAVIGWVIFRSEDWVQMTSYLAGMFSADILNYPAGSLNGQFYIIPLIAFLIMMEWISREHEHGLSSVEKLNKIVRYIVYITTIFTIWLFGSDSSSAFIYFQF